MTLDDLVGMQPELVGRRGMTADPTNSVERRNERIVPVPYTPIRHSQKTVDLTRNCDINCLCSY
jgi:hypothetical protein